MERGQTPALLPIFRSQQQAEILALLLGDSDLELSLTDIAVRTGVPTPSVHRAVGRAEVAGIVTSRRIGNTRLVRANTGSPYFEGLADVLTKAFGVPSVLASSLAGVAGIVRAFIFGSWAAGFHGKPGSRPVGDIDLLVLGEPDRNRLYEVLHGVQSRLGRPVQVTVRDADWVESGSGLFHDTIMSRALVELALKDYLSSSTRNG